MILSGSEKWGSFTRRRRKHRQDRHQGLAIVYRTMRKSSNIFTQKARKNGNPRTRSSPEDQSDTTCVKNDPYNTIMHPPRSHYSTFRSLSVNDAGKHAKRSTGSHVSGQKAERGKEAAQRPFGKLNGTSRKQENTRAIIHFDQATCGQPVSAFVGGQVERKRPGKSDQAARGQGRPDGASAEPRQRRGFHASRSAVRRYALYRGMLRTYVSTLFQATSLVKDDQSIPWYYFNYQMGFWTPKVRTMRN